jgi:hypothetical protein
MEPDLPPPPPGMRFTEAYLKAPMEESYSGDPEFVKEMKKFIPYPNRYSTVEEWNNRRPVQVFEKIS